MEKLKNILIIVLLAIFIIASNSVTYAKVITKSDLEQAFDKIYEQKNKEATFSFEIDEKIIKIVLEEEKYEIEYDLQDKPTFICKSSITDGMSYDDFENEIDRLQIILFGYIAITNLQGVNFDDSILYFMSNILQSASNQTQEKKYIVVDDTSSSDEINAIANTGKKVIKKSEFGKYAMECVNSIYKNKTIVDDSNDANTFKWTIERKDIKENSCSIVSTLEVNSDADFSKLKGYTEKIKDSTDKKDVIDNVNDNIDMKAINEKLKDSLNIKNDKDQTNKKDTNNKENKKEEKLPSEKSTANIKTIPRSGREFGIDNVLQIIIAISIITIFIMLITSKKGKK